jgi:hypothetical protein
MMMLCLRARSSCQFAALALTSRLLLAPLLAPQSTPRAPPRVRAAMEALLAQAVALGVSEAHARRVLRALADTVRCAAAHLATSSVR